MSRSISLRTAPVFVAAITLLLTACGGSDDGASSPSSSAGGSKSGSSDEALNYWYVNPLPNTPDWGRSGKLFEEAASTQGYEANLVGPNKIDIPAMIGQIEQAVSSGADGIITCPLDPNAFKAAVSAAKAKDIVVASIGCVDPNADFSVGTGNVEFGKLAADLIAEQTGGKANVGILGTDQTTPNQVEAVKGFREQVKAKYPDVKELVWESDKSDAGVAAEKLGAMIGAYPEMNYVWIIEGAAPGAVPAAMEEAGKEAGDIRVLAVDAQDSTLKAIEEGWITTTLNQCWFDASPKIAELMTDIIRNGTKPESFYAIPVDPVSKENLPYTGCQRDKIEAVFGS